MSKKSLKSYKHVTLVGGHTVIDTTGVAQQNSDGDVELTLDELAAYERRAAIVVLSDVPHVEGDVLKFARKALGLRQTELATILDVEAETLSRWETGKLPFKHNIQLAMVALLCVAQKKGTSAVQRLAEGMSEEPRTEHWISEAS